MAYRLKSSESVPEGIKRITCEEIESAAALLTGSSAANRDEAVHEARKSIKKVRAILRLMRSELDGGIYKMENMRLRDVGRGLSEYRDARAIIDVFDSLKQRYGQELGKNTTDSIRQGLLKRKRQRERDPGINRKIQTAAATLELVGKGVNDWPLQTDGFAAVAPGLTETFRQSRKRMALARENSRPENCHAWRKRVKGHWYHVRLLEDLWTDLMQGYEKSLKDLETWLGDHHNLTVLSERLRAEPNFYGRQSDIDLCLDMIRKYQKELRKNALSLGERIFAERPKQFEKRMKVLWSSWHSEPKTLREIEKQKRKQETA